MRPDGAWFDTDKLLVGGVWIEASSRETLAVVDPSDGSTLCAIARDRKQTLTRRLLRRTRLGPAIGAD
jgi:hypothetical protein